MPRITVTTTAQATVTEEWVLDVTDEQLALLQEDEATRSPDKYGNHVTDSGYALDLVNGEGTYVNVENVQVENEHDREATGFERVADDFTNEGQRGA